jgi:ubiquinone/menaquinone biosynthesis C-methylase UbiE
MCFSKIIDWNQSANEYSKLGLEISFYKETAIRMVEMSCQDTTQTIVDLGCGSSGFLTRKILKHAKNLQELYCIDSSAEMIKILAKKINSSKVHFINSKAEHFNNYLNKKVDIIVCNSAFWMFDISKTLIAVRNSLKSSGRFIFNIAEFDYEFEKTEVDIKYQTISRHLEKRQFNAGNSMRKKYKFNRSMILNLISTSGFSLKSETFVNTDVTATDWEKFYQIPTIASKCLPNIPLEISQEVLMDAMQDLYDKNLPSIRWVFFELIKDNY